MSKQLLLAAIKTAIAAGEKIMEIYSTSFSVELKEDRSPLTAADKASHELIVSALTQFGFPILSEEGKDVSYEERSKWKNYWCVDPLDGTKEFVKRNGEFTVNIAFMEGKSPVFGVIYQPAAGELHAGYDGKVYFLKKDDIENLQGDLTPFELNAEKAAQTGEIKVVASRSHLSPETEKYIHDLEKEGRAIAMVNAGSALKFCLLAAGKAHVYPRFAPTMEWDTAAGHAILKAFGKNIYLWPSMIEMNYNKPSLVNDWFVAE